MPTVYNWQIGRDMEYWYEQARPKRQAAAVFDTNKCINCQTCTMACKTTWTSGKGQEYMYWNNVETKPWGSYPLAYDVKVLDLLGPQKWARRGDGYVYGGRTIFEAASPLERVLGYLPDDLEYAYPNRGEDETNIVLTPDKFHIHHPHEIWFFYLARLCNHCTYPACLAACPRMAIYKREEDGVVLVDQSRCRGYRECMAACPYKKVFYNHVTRIAEKCVFCYPAIERGAWPRCMRNCIGKIRMFGYRSTPDKANPENPLDFLIHTRKVALPLMPQLGLEPNIYYIPPVHIENMDFLKMLFGPQAPDAVSAYSKALKGEDIELTAALLLNVSTDRIMAKFKVIRDTEEVVGYSEKGDEVVRMPMREPNIVRRYYDEELKVYRHNIT